jgi:hypothetical protein
MFVLPPKMEVKHSNTCKFSPVLVELPKSGNKEEQFIPNDTVKYYNDVFVFGFFLWNSIIEIHVSLRPSHL